MRRTYTLLHGWGGVGVSGHPLLRLYRDDVTGIAWVEHGSTGLNHSCHANIDATGSVRGMKTRGYWRKTDRTVRSHGFVFNVDTYVVDDELDRLAAEACQCVGCQDRRAQEWDQEGAQVAYEQEQEHRAYSDASVGGVRG